MSGPVLMSALRKLRSGPGGIDLKQVPVPEPEAGTVLIKVVYAAVCATDVHLRYDRFANSPPFTLGHEFSGVVTKLGTGVSSVKVGDRVVSENNPGSCGVCRVCRKGFPNLCPNKRAMGIHTDGAFAEYVCLPASLLHTVPASIDLSDASLLEPVAVSMHTLSEAGYIEEGDVVTVLGPGAIGLLCAQIARERGAKTVIVAGTNPDEQRRLALAQELGFVPVNVEKKDLTEVVLSLSNGLGADVVVEASGSGRAIAALHALVRRAGRVAAVGITGKETITIPWDALISKGVTCRFSYSSISKDWEEGLRLLSENRIQTDKLISNRYPLREWEQAFEAAEKISTVRSLLVIGEEHG